MIALYVYHHHLLSVFKYGDFMRKSLWCVIDHDLGK